MPQITQERLKELLSYNPTTGIFTRLTAIKYQPIQIGDSAGCTRELYEGLSYITIVLDGQAYQAHMLVWLYMHGYLSDLIDHKDGDSMNNRLGNLRECSPAQNAWNRKKINTNTTGVKGLTKRYYWQTDTLSYRCIITTNGVTTSKTFKETNYATRELAFIAAKEWLEITRKELHGDFANNG